jgi:hypothetical protein
VTGVRYNQGGIIRARCGSEGFEGGRREIGEEVEGQLMLIGCRVAMIGASGGGGSVDDDAVDRGLESKTQAGSRKWRAEEEQEETEAERRDHKAPDAGVEVEARWGMDGG